MKFEQLKTVLDNFLPVWCNIDGVHCEYYLTVDDIPETYNNYEVEFLTIDGDNKITLQLITKEVTLK